MLLSEVSSVHPGYTARSRLEAAPTGGVPVIQLRDVTESGAADPAVLGRVDFKERIDRYTVTAGDVLFRSRGESNVAVALDDRFVEPVVAVLPFMILRPARSIIDPAYLAWIINQPLAQGHFNASARGTNLRMVPRSSLDELEIDVPDLETQRRIVAIADLATREERLLRQLAAARRTLTNRLLAECAKGNRSITKTRGKPA